MVSVNVTLVVQVINFLCAWWFLERFFFRLFVRNVQKKHATLSLLASDISQAQRLMVEETTKKESKWAQLRKLFAQTIPPILSRKQFCSAGILCPVTAPLKEEKKQALLQDLKNLIVKEALQHD